MVESGYDMSSLRQFRFELYGFETVQLAETLKKEIENKGYEVYMHIFEEGVYIFQVIVHVIPSIDTLRKIESYIQSIALKNNLEYIHFKAHNIENA